MDRAGTVVPDPPGRVRLGLHGAGWPKANPYREAGAKSVALVCQQPLHKPKFLLWDRHGAANALTPQPFLVAPNFDRENRSFQEEHVNALVHEGAAELVGPSIGSALELGHTPQGSVLAVRVV